MNQKLTKLEKRWILYDVGNSAFVLLTSTIIPIYYKNIASASGISDSDSTAFFGYATWGRCLERWRIQRDLKSRCLLFS